MMIIIIGSLSRPISLEPRALTKAGKYIHYISRPMHTPHTHTYTHIYTHTHHTHTHIHTHTHTHTNTHAHTCTCAHTHTNSMQRHTSYACTRTHKHTHTDAHTLQNTSILVMGLMETEERKRQNSRQKRRCVFSFGLKEESEVACLTEKGREFQMTGPIY